MIKFIKKIKENRISPAILKPKIIIAFIRSLLLKMKGSVAQANLIEDSVFSK